MFKNIFIIILVVLCIYLLFRLSEIYSNTLFDKKIIPGLLERIEELTIQTIEQQETQRIVDVLSFDTDMLLDNESTKVLDTTDVAIIDTCHKPMKLNSQQKMPETNISTRKQNFEISTNSQTIPKILEVKEFEHIPDEYEKLLI